MRLRSKNNSVVPKLVNKNIKKVQKAPFKLLENVISCLQEKTFQDAFPSDNEKSFNLELSLDSQPEPQCASSQIPKNDSQFVKLKSMTKRKHYVKIKEFDSAIDVDDFLRSENQYPLIITHNTKVNCTLCENHDCHKMTQMYRKCQCKKEDCDLAYKVNNCLNSSVWILSETGAHPVPIQEGDYVSVQAGRRKPIKRYGIALRIQEIYGRWLKSVKDRKKNTYSAKI